MTRNHLEKRTLSISLLTITGLFAAMITLMTAYICHIPYGSNGGYIHFGDTLIYLAAALLPRPYALTAAAIWRRIGGYFSTAPMWAPATIIIKMLIVLPFTSKTPKLLNAHNLVAPLISLMISATGYYLAEGLLFGSFIAPIASLSGSAIQSGGSAVLFLLSASALDRMHFKNKLWHF